MRRGGFDVSFGEESRMAARTDAERAVLALLGNDGTAFGSIRRPCSIRVARRTAHVNTRTNVTASRRQIA